MILALVGLALLQSGNLHLDAADGKLESTHLESTRPGYSGRGYATGFTTDQSRLSFTFRASAGIYDIRIRYCASQGGKGFGLIVDGQESGGFFEPTTDQFSSYDAGLVELKEGENSLAITKGWGYFDIDSVDINPAKVPGPPSKPSPQLADSQATPGTQLLFQKLLSTYGSKVLSGQYSDQDVTKIRLDSGKAPAIYSSDLMDLSPSRVAHGSKSTAIEDILKASSEGYIPSLSWHWNAPSHLKDAMLHDAQGHEINALWYKGFYTNATDFDLQYAIDNPDSKDGKLLISDIDVIAGHLKKLSDAGVSILWRPVHEAEGGWFWWGAKGPEAFKKLWKLIFVRLTGVHHLHNLIWVYSSGTNPAWYPGDGYVDVVGIDTYPASQDDPLTSTWNTLLQQHPTKLLAVTEFGGIPNPARMRKFGVYFDYFVSWSGSTDRKDVTPERIRTIYTQPEVFTKK